MKESWQSLLARLRGRLRGRLRARPRRDSELRGWRDSGPRERKASTLRERLSARRTTIGGAWRGVPGDARDSTGFSDPGNRGGPLGAGDEMPEGGDSTRFPPGARPRERKTG